MATGQIRITPDQLESEAGKLHNLADQHDGIFGQITSLVNALSSQWEGAAVDAFQQTYETTKKELAKFRQAVDVFEADMKLSAAKLREMDQALASQFRR